VNSVLEQLITPVVTVGVRLGILMSFAPFFGSNAISARVKAGLTMVLTALVYPLCAPKTVASNPAMFAQIVFGEVVIGLALALSVQFVFEGVQLAGQILGFQIGFSLVNVIDPQTNVEIPVLSTLHQAVMLFVFFRLSVDHWLLRALVKSFEYVPPGSVTVSPAAVRHLVGMALGLIARAAPQVPVLFLGMSIKSLVGMGVLVGAVGFWPKLFERYFEGVFRASEQLIMLVH
jgi:flagellar biosynthetic protein FliR